MDITLNYILSNNRRDSYQYQLLTQLPNWLLEQKLSNYGYTVKQFNSLKSRASRLRMILKREGIDLAQRYGIYDRLVLSDGQWGYNVGQSFNEEYITLLECLTGRGN